MSSLCLATVGIVNLVLQFLEQVALSPVEAHPMFLNQSTEAWGQPFDDALDELVYETKSWKPFSPRSLANIMCHEGLCMACNKDLRYVGFVFACCSGGREKIC